jgi:hypothetical protein
MLHGEMVGLRAQQEDDWAAEWRVPPVRHLHQRRFRLSTI